MFSAAYKIAKDSTFDRHKLGAIITRGHRVLSVGYNSIRYTKELGYGTLHAEEAAILKLMKSRRQHLLVGAELYVTRVRPNGSCGLSRPCDRCMSLIKAVGIKKVHYTTDEGTETIKC
ncbi:MAG TPA: deaminase [Methanosarcina sp.]|nr:deaminase [Methanosarcina sp.]